MAIKLKKSYRNAKGAFCRNVPRLTLQRLRGAVLLFSMASLLMALGQTNCLAQSGSATPWFVRTNDAWAQKLSQPTFKVRFQHGVKVPMRDGVALSANIWRPQAEGKFPIVLMLTPYGISDSSTSVIADPIGHAKFLAPRGYAVVAISTRGRYESGGTSYFYWHQDWRKGRFEGQDVYDAIVWLNKQPWSAGKVAMTGGSYLGFVQWMGAYLQPPGLTALVPYVSPDDHYINFFPSGAFRLSAGMHTLAILSGGVNKYGLTNDFWNWNEITRHLPLRNMDEVMLGRKEPFWQDFMDHPNNDEYWRFSVGEQPRVLEITAGKYPKVQVPTLNITGWYDTMQQPVINNYMGMVKYGPKQLQDKHMLIVGPWFHNVGPRKLGDLDFGADAEVDFLMVELRWYDYWLKGIENGILDEPRVNLFALGTNQWRQGNQWPLAEASTKEYYFHSTGKANTRFGDGTLSETKPADERPDRFVYDPENPVPTFGGNTRMYPLIIGPKDQRNLQEREDVLVYTGPALDADLEVSGRIVVKLYAASDAPDTDFTGKLIDVHPNGYSQILKDGVIRARYRESFKSQQLLTPGKIYEYTIDLWSVHNVFRKGHKIQVEISSSNFPKYDRNPNTGSRFGEDTKLSRATQTIYHDTAHPSRIILPVLP